MSPEDPAEIIARLWESHRDVVAARLNAIDGGIAAISIGVPRSDAVVQEAHRAAHNLAGALGSYGRPQGSTTARELMATLLDAHAAPGAMRMLLEKLNEACV